MLRQFAAHVAVAIENARLFEHEREYTSTLETLSRHRPRVRRDPRSRRAAHAHRQPDAAASIDYRTFGILLLNHGHAGAGDEGRRPLRRQGHRAAREDRHRPGGLRRAAQRGGARPGRVDRSALHQGRRRRAVGAGDPAAAAGPVHRRVRPREPRARRVQQEPRRNPDAARQPGGRGDRERPAVRDDPRQRGPAREGDPLRAARAGRAPADRAAEADEGRGRRRPLRAGARARGRSLRLPRARAATASPWRSATCRAKACPPRSTAPLPASWSARARSAAATRPSASAPPASWRRSTRSCTSGSSRSTTARSATPSSTSSGAR